MLEELPKLVGWTIKEVIISQHRDVIELPPSWFGAERTGKLIEGRKYTWITINLERENVEVP